MRRDLSKTLAVAAVSIAALAALPASRAVASVLSPSDASAYALAFRSAGRGDFESADKALSRTSDKSLVGYVQYQKLVWPQARPTYPELSGWLKRYSDLPGADRIYQLALRRKPRRVHGLRPPPGMARISGGSALYDGSRGQAARDAYYSGDVQTAYRLATASGERWIAGLSAFRLKHFAEAMGHFQQVALNSAQNDWQRAGAAYWAARSAIAGGMPERAPDFLRIASRSPSTFYGMIAERHLGLAPGADPQAYVLEHAGFGPAQPAADTEVIKASFSDHGDPELAPLVRSDLHARRAVALAEIGRTTESGLELRLGVSRAGSDELRRQWTTLALDLNNTAMSQAQSRHPGRFDPDDYPTPQLTPIGGFTLDKALVYAVVRQESRFDPYAVSPAGAVGLMQLMPTTAAQAAGDDKLLTDATPLYDPATNLRVGQDYLAFLLEQAAGGDMIKAIAAYDGGPGTLLRTLQLVGDDDPLMLIESLPAAETRAYVEKVVANYWIYRRMFGEDARTIDSVASGATLFDAKLDR